MKKYFPFISLFKQCFDLYLESADTCFSELYGRLWIVMLPKISENENQKDFAFFFIYRCLSYYLINDIFERGNYKEKKKVIIIIKWKMDKM